MGRFCTGPGSFTGSYWTQTNVNIRLNVRLRRHMYRLTFVPGVPAEFPPAK